MATKNIEEIPFESIKEIPLEQIKSPDKDRESLLTTVEKEKTKEGQEIEEQEEGEKDKVKDKFEESSLLSKTNSNLALKKREEAIDNILAEGLSNIFLKMKENEQKQFKQKGEETAKKINILLSDAKTKANKIIDLIRKWLKLIPGVNKFFIEQETKLKADKIMKIRNNF